MGKNVINIKILFDNVEMIVRGKDYLTTLNKFKNTMLGNAIIAQGYDLDDVKNETHITMVDGKIIRYIQR